MRLLLALASLCQPAIPKKKKIWKLKMEIYFVQKSFSIAHVYNLTELQSFKGNCPIWQGRPVGKNRKQNQKTQCIAVDECNKSSIRPWCGKYTVEQELLTQWLSSHKRRCMRLGVSVEGIQKTSISLVSSGSQGCLLTGRGNWVGILWEAV